MRASTRRTHFGHLRRLAALAVAVIAIDARAELVEIAWDKAGRFETVVSVAPGKFAEVCGQLAQGQSNAWSEFRRQMVELVQAGRTPAQRAREFSCSAQTISTWVARAAADTGRPSRVRDALSSVERDELARLRRENKRLLMERDILAKATAWFAAKGDETSIGTQAVRQ